MGTTWNLLPDGLPEHDLVEEMRHLKDAKGLSYGKLASLTNYSTSSWERFFNGKKPPTREAVEQLAEATGTEPHRLLALWELGRKARQHREAAATAQDHRAGAGGDDGCTQATGAVSAATGDAHTRTTRTTVAQTAAAGEVHADADPACAYCGRRGPRGARRLAPVAAALITGLVVGLLTAFSLGGPGRSDAPTPAAAPSKKAVATPSPAPECREATCDGKDPQAMACSADGRTARTTVLHGVRVELRHSPACRAVWGKITNAAVKDTVKIYDGKGRQQMSSVRWGQDAYTDMLSTRNVDEITVCARIIPGRNGKPYEEECSRDGAATAPAVPAPAAASASEEQR